MAWRTYYFVMLCSPGRFVVSVLWQAAWLLKLSVVGFAPTLPPMLMEARILIAHRAPGSVAASQAVCGLGITAQGP